MGKGKRYNNESKLNIKKVVAVIVALLVIVMFVIVIQKLLQTAKEPQATTTLSYYPVYTNEKWGVIDSQGNIVIEPTLDEMITIPDNKTDIFISLYDVDNTNHTYKTKVLNAKQKELFTNYDTVEIIENHDKNNILWYEKGVLKVKKDGKYGLINLEGKEILSPEYDDIQALTGYQNSLLLSKGDTIGLCDNNGKLIIKPEYSEIKGIGEDYQNGYIVGTVEGNYGIIDFTGKEILKIEYADIKEITGNGYYVVQKENIYQVIDSEKNIILNGGFDTITHIQEDKIIYTKNGKVGVMNDKAEQIIKPEYQELVYAYPDCYIAKKGGKYGIILENQEKVPFVYNHIQYRKQADFFELEKEDEVNSTILNHQLEEKLQGIVSEINEEKGYFRLYTENGYHYYNFQFEEKMPAEILTKNTLFLSKKDSKYGYVDKNGNVVVDYQYEDGLEQNQFGYVAVNKDGKWGALDKSGKQIVEPTYELENNIVIDFIGKWHLGEDINLNYYTDQK